MPDGTLARYRAHELELAISWMRPGGSVLEIGAGAGWQARILAECGFSVEAIDIETSAYRAIRVFPVQDYDGLDIPFADHCFDHVFSSNVLEHVAHGEGLQREILRVLSPGGRAVHILPTTAWRAWTMSAHLPALLARSIRRMRETLAAASDTSVSRSRLAKRLLGHLLRSAADMIPPRHGERGNVLTELYYFSGHHWRRFFESCGWCLIHRQSCGLFYTGHSLLGSRLSFTSRRRLSRVLGSACTLYVLQASGGGGPKRATS